MKKSIVYIVFLVSISITFKVSAQNDTIERTYYYENGQVSSTGLMIDEKPVGYWRNYYPTGILKSEGNRENFQLQDLWKFYSETGDIQKEITFKTGKRHGLTRIYNDSCYVVRIEPYVNDKLEGEVREYFEHGKKLRQTVPYVEGIKDGVAYEFARDGRIITITTYNHGFIKKKEEINRRNELGKQGTWRKFYSDGDIHIESRYKNDVLHGYYKEYDKDGILVVALLYIDGIVQENPEELMSLEIKKSYYNDGTVEWEGTFNYKGEEEGTFKYFNKKGEIKEARIYSKGILLARGEMNEKGERIGPWEFYFPDSSFRAKGEYQDGLRIGKWTFWHPNGQVEQKGKYGKNEKPHGDWVWYYSNGEVWREEGFWKGLEDGMAVEYSDTGTVISKGEYINGKKEGIWFYEMGDHWEEGEYIEGRRNGEWVWEYGNGKTKFKGTFINGDPHGRHIYYYSNGQVKREEYYELGFEEGTWKSYDELGNLIITSQYDGGREVKIGNKRVK